MENENEQNQEDVKDVEGQGEANNQEAVVDDRPERNYKAELDRKNREIERLRQEKENLQVNGAQRRDPTDVTTWPDHELKAIIHSNDPQLLSLKDQAEETLFGRRVERARTKEREQEKRFTADMELRKSYPEALDPSSPLSTRMEEIMYQYDLQKSPAGRLAAAKIAASELSKGKTSAEAKGRKAEEQRVRDVKAQLVDGDRPKSTNDAVTQKKAEELKDRIIKGDSNAVGDVLKQRGISGKDFFGNRKK